MEFQTYAIYDKVGDSYLRFGSYPNDVSAIRDLTVIALGDLRIPLRDLEVHKLELKMVSTPEWSLYKFPESNAEALAPLGASPEDIQRAFEQKTKDIQKEV